MKYLLTILIFILFSCDKNENNKFNNQTKQQCSNWNARWSYYLNNIFINDSIILEVAYYGFKNDKSFTQYKSNLKQFDSLLWHYCPITKELNSDKLIFIKQNDTILLRYYH